MRSVVELCEADGGGKGVPCKREEDSEMLPSDAGMKHSKNTGGKYMVMV